MLHKPKLQINMLHEQLEHQNAANTMENGRFKTQKRGKHLVEMAASNSSVGNPACRPGCMVCGSRPCVILVLVRHSTVDQAVHGKITTVFDALTQTRWSGELGFGELQRDGSDQERCCYPVTWN